MEFPINTLFLICFIIWDISMLIIFFFFFFLKSEFNSVLYQKDLKLKAFALSTEQVKQKEYKFLKIPLPTWLSDDKVTHETDTMMHIAHFNFAYQEESSTVILGCFKSRSLN